MTLFLQKNVEKTMSSNLSYYYFKLDDIFTKNVKKTMSSNLSYYYFKLDDIFNKKC
jgi:selenocysteine-specific translation elongation factor